MKQREQTIADMVFEVLEDGASTGFEIARALEEDHRLTLRGREGALYVALLELVRDGWLSAEWETRPGGRRRRIYSLPVLEQVADTSGATPA